MVTEWDRMGFDGALIGFNGDFVGFNGM